MVEKLAIITGASTGIGFELANIAAEEGYDLIIVADGPLIDAAAADFRNHGVNVISVEADLATFEGVDKVLAAAEGRQIDVLCTNAGSAHGSAFQNQGLDSAHHRINTDITGTIYLLQRVLPQMVSRNDGKILVTDSVEGYIPGGFNAAYNATKAFFDNFTEALRNEIRELGGVTLTTLMPAAPATEFFDRADMLDTRVGKADPSKVARDGWDAMISGKGQIVSGGINKLQVAVAGIAPQAALAEMHRKVVEPGSG